ncbi:YcxB family protein [Erythrobacter sp. YJ-T3-07]|uniref:YcxB family protein n=1 Tax=Erythrobacter sp. YJ-T3-07 TaxID=2793063 RepID=UPI0018D35B5B|nr:YcxB family protein [Erythrobacter sp. YJ-T3-07]MBH1944166.1 YcxB family protein [Erythrobacter sp. YJ-T3-07]
MPDQKDWISANWLIVRHRWLWRRFLVAFLILWAIYAALLVGVDAWFYAWDPAYLLADLRDALLYTTIVAAVLVALTAFALPYRVRKMKADTSRLIDGLEIETDVAGIRTSSAIGQLSLTWSQIKRWHENDRLLALMVTDREMILISKGQVEATIVDSIRAHLNNSVEAGLTP